MTGLNLYMRAAKRSTTLLCAGVVSVALGACAPVPLDAPKPVSFAAVAPPSSKLQQSARALAADRPASHTSFAPLADGNEALGARLRSIEAAEQTIDLQYFLMKPDLAGALVSQALLKAADRGVRVRYLIDDVFTTVSDDTLGYLDAHPNMEVRVFNPSARPGSKFLNFVTEFARVNRRMHNKIFTVDGASAIIGGRNIADEYFQIQTTSEFADFEMLLTGPAVADVQKAFDLYWNDGWSVPMSRLKEPPSQAELAQARSELDARLVPARDVYDKAVNDPYFARLSAGEEAIFSGPTTVVVDRPVKVKTPVRGGERVLAETLLRRMKNAKKDVILITPYFVPEDYGARLFENLAQRGVRVRIVTNSVGSTNHTYVHAGYRRHREPLLRAGVEIYELRSDAMQALGELPPDDKTGLVMHSKAAVIDTNEVFVGSMNLDPRSVKINSELGVFFDSPAFGRFMQERLQIGLRDYAYRLSLAPDGRLLWHYDNPQARSVTVKEPGATAWNGFVIGLTELLGVESQL